MTDIVFASCLYTKYYLNKLNVMKYLMEWNAIRIIAILMPNQQQLIFTSNPFITHKNHNEKNESFQHFIKLVWICALYWIVCWFITLSSSCYIHGRQSSYSTKLISTWLDRYLMIFINCNRVLYFHRLNLCCGFNYIQFACLYTTRREREPLLL